MVPLPKIFGGLGLHFGRQMLFQTPEWHRRLVYNYLHGNPLQSFISQEILKSISLEKQFDRGKRVDNV
jgi:hypothetical protein